MFLSYYSLLIIWHAVQFVVTNIDQMYKEMKKIVQVGKKHGNGEKFPDFGDLFFFFGVKYVRVGGKKINNNGQQ